MICIYYCPVLAAGKSTFVRLLEEHDREWEVVPEPIARWCNVQTHHNEHEVQSEITERKKSVNIILYGI